MAGEIERILTDLQNRTITPARAAEMLRSSAASSSSRRRRLNSVPKEKKPPHDSADLIDRRPEMDRSIGLPIIGGHEQVGSGRAYGVVLRTVHALEEVGIGEWEVGAPEAGEVTVEVRASAINFPDVMCVQGLYPTMPEYPYVPGFEVAGVIVEVGEGVSGIEVGEEVLATTGRGLGGHAGRVNVPAGGVVRKPENITFEEACSIPVVFSTVGYAFEVGHVQAGDEVLIQTATGGCGLAALQLGRLRGCRCYGTSSRAEKLELLRKLGVEHAINYRREDFEEEVRRVTGQRGVDVVLNMVSGEAIQHGLNCLAPFGRYLEIAVHALRSSGKLDLSRLVNNQSIHSIDLRRLSLEKGKQWRGALEEAVVLMARGKLVPIVSRIYPIRQIREALEYVGEGRHIGKVVISHVSSEMVDCSERCVERLLEQKQRSERERVGRRKLISVTQSTDSGVVETKPINRLRENTRDTLNKTEVSSEPMPIKNANGYTKEINGIQMYYEVHGRGEPLVFLHGLAGTGAMWRLVFNQLPSGYQLIVPDLRGHGRSCNPSGKLTYRQCANDVFALLEHLGVTRFKAIGVSLGGLVLLHMATQSPEQVESMVLVGTAHYFPEKARMLSREMKIDDFRAEHWNVLRQRHAFGDQQISAIINHAIEIKDSYDDLNFTPTYLSSIQADTLIVHGDQDELYPVSIAFEMHSAIPRSHLWVVPNGAHTPIFGDMQQEFLRVCLSFLDGNWRHVETPAGAIPGGDNELWGGFIEAGKRIKAAALSSS